MTEKKKEATSQARCNSYQSRAVAGLHASGELGPLHTSGPGTCTRVGPK